MPRRIIAPPFADRLVVGSWPGRGFAWNSFIGQFCVAIEHAGCEVVDVDDPRWIARRLDVLHIHWPEQIFWKEGGALKLAARTALTLRALYDLRRVGVRLVWMVHNLRPHELAGARAPLWRLIEATLPRLVDGFMTLCPATVEVVRRAIPALAELPAASAWHPAYPAPAVPRDRTTARAASGLPADSMIFAFIGLIRPYKGVEELIAAFSALQSATSRLLIAGHCDSLELATSLRQRAAADERIDLRLGRLDDFTLAELTAAADIVVLPLRDYLHSGSMIYAISHARAVITPASPFADSLAALVGSQWVSTYSGPLRTDLLGSAKPAAGAPDLTHLSAEALGSAAATLYRQLARQPDRQSG